jgi:hypothetical protein
MNTDFEQWARELAAKEPETTMPQQHVTIGWVLILAFLILFWGSVGILTYRIIVGA